MTRRQLNKLSMLMALNEYFTVNLAIVKTIPNLESIANAIKSLINSIQSQSEQQIMNRNGVGDLKKIIKSNLISDCADIARKLSAFAAINNNDMLLNQSKTSDYKLSRLSDENLVSVCMLILDLGKQNLTAATTYGLNQASLTKLDTDIKSFVNIIPDPRLAKVDKKQATDQLVILFNQAEELLIKSDLLVGIVKLNQPIFFAGYKSVRAIIDIVGRGLQLKISVVNKSSDEPISGALCQLIHDNTTNKSGIISKKTATKGSANIKSLDEGKYNLTVSKSGYKTEIQIVYVTKNEFASVIIKLEKI
jgi:hypothetical protein